MASTLLDTSKGIVEFSYKGIGPAILLLKGGHCTRETDLSHSSLIYEGYSLLTISRPGYDYTEAEAGRTPDEFADTIAEVLDHLNIKKVSVIAVSAAGPTGVSFVAHHPERVDKLILEAALVSPWDAKQIRKAKILFGQAERAVWGGIHTAMKLFPEFVMKQVLSEMTTENVDDFLNELTPNDRRFIYDMLMSSQSENGFGLDLTHTIGDMTQIKVPVLGMYSKKDKSVPYTNALLLKSKIPHAQIVEVDADSHLIWIGNDAKNVWNKRLNFLTQPSAKEAHHG
ncbi:alpha/beta fold hydrolase [Halobacillus salinus]|uniref:Alpha/beta hydrolase n=1 Tax=Halobacillus salinus TaxID=192814 RepID=A0A4Z0H4I6_9BACI|nr:alpha/beta hydrolase [Halobacillus salinus]TGB05332.1 alpha/beta hydrolase [Halobacillus salinus]